VCSCVLCVVWGVVWLSKRLYSGVLCVVFVCFLVLVVRLRVRGVAIKKRVCFYYSLPATSMTKRRVGH